MKACLFCGKSVAGTKDANRKKYCDKECYRQHRLSHPLTNKSTAHYRARVKRMAACERCGADISLHVHHKDRNPLNDSMENLGTLCSVCHHREHLNDSLSTCVVCGTSFRAASHRNRNKACSASCVSEWGRINARKRWGRAVSADSRGTATRSSRPSPRK